jgi:hypothetical protein
VSCPHPVRVSRRSHPNHGQPPDAPGSRHHRCGPAPSPKTRRRPAWDVLIERVPDFLELETYVAGVELEALAMIAIPSWWATRFGEERSRVSPR